MLTLFHFPPLLASVNPHATPDSHFQAKVASFHKLKASGTHFNTSLARNRAFRNPHIYAKLVKFVDVLETGTNYPKEVWDPHGLPKEAYADRIGEFIVLVRVRGWRTACEDRLEERRELS